MGPMKKLIMCFHKLYVKDIMDPIVIGIIVGLPLTYALIISRLKMKRRQKIRVLTKSQAQSGKN